MQDVWQRVVEIHDVTSIANMPTSFSLFRYIFCVHTIILMPKLVVLFYKHAHFSTRYLKGFFRLFWILYFFNYEIGIAKTFVDLTENWNAFFIV